MPLPAPRPLALPCFSKKPSGSFLAALLLVAMAVLWAPRAAMAHAVLLRASPAPNGRLAVPPAEVDLFFSEALNQHFSSVQVRGSNNQSVGARALRFTSDPTEMDLPLPDLAPGFYSVVWTTVSRVDGHRLQGSYPFTVLNPDGSEPTGAPAQTATAPGSSSPAPVDVALRWLMLLGVVLSAGAYAFGGLIVLPAVERLAEERGRAQTWALGLAGRTAVAAGGLVAVINLEVLARQADQVGGPAQLGRLLASRSGSYWSAREIAAVLGCAAGGLLMAHRPRVPGRGVKGMFILGLLLFAIEGATIALTSHAAAGGGAGWSVPSDFVHIIAVGAWLGPLLMLPILLFRPPKLSAPDLRALRGVVIDRFSFIASIAIVAVLATGLFNASVEVGSLRNLSGTGYGRTLLVKVVLSLPVFGLGALNALRVARRAAGGQQGGDAGPGLLARTAAAEGALACCVLAAAAVLVLLVPAKDEAAQRLVRPQPSAATASVYRNSVAAGGLRASLVVSPNRPGDNTLTVTLTGSGVDRVTRVQFRFQSPDPSVGGSTVDATPAAPGQYQAQAANLTVAGRWQIVVNVRRSGEDDVNGNFVVDVQGAGASASSPARAGLWDFPASGITANQALGLLLAGFALLLARFRSRMRLGRWSGRAARLMVGVPLFLGAMLFFAVHSHQGSGSAQVLDNPVPADQRSIDDGYRHFQTNCAACHGATGHGDGPLSPGLIPKPFDLTVHVGLHPDWQLYDWITNGIPPTAMPAWKDRLTDQERWDLVNYLRTLSAVTRSPSAIPVSGGALRANAAVQDLGSR